MNQTLLFRAHIRPGEGNSVYLKDALIHRSKLRLAGQGHRVFVKGKLYNSQLEVYGTGNRIILSRGCEIHDAKIIIRGSHCLFYLGEQSSLGGGRVVLMGRSNKIDIGRDCMLSDQLEIWATDSHPIRQVDSQEIINPSRPIIIQDRVWIGSRSTVLKGVTIGAGAIVGMNSVVTCNLSGGQVYVGNPCRSVKQDISWQRSYIEV